MLWGESSSRVIGVGVTAGTSGFVCALFTEFLLKSLYILPIPCILVPILLSSFPCEGPGGGVGGEKPMAITSFLFFACIPGIVIDMAPYVGCETIGVALTPGEGLGEGGTFRAVVSLEFPVSPGCLDGEASSRVSTTVGTLLADGGGLYLGNMVSS